MKKGNVKKSSRNRTRFTIDLDIRGLVFMVMMMTLTAIAIFYLGTIFGKASRNPNKNLSIAGLDENTTGETSPLKLPKDLAIFDINDDPKKIDALKKDFENIAKETDQAKKEMNTQAIPPNDKGDTFADIGQKQAVWPAQKPDAKKSRGLYTIQVFVTKSKEKAKNITRQLKQKSFDAYLSEVTIEGKKLYRIRVGRKSKENIDVLKKNHPQAQHPVEPTSCQKFPA